MAGDRSTYDEKLKNILRTAAGIFAEKGYHQASIRDISRATGVSLSGLYYYFQSKEELLFLIQEHSFGTLLANLDAMMEGVDDPHRQIRIVIENHLRFFVSNMAEMKVLSHEADSLTGELWVRVNAQKRRLTEIVARILSELRPEGDLDLRVSVFSLFGMMNWLYNWYRPERDVPVSQLAEQMSRLFLAGYLSDGTALPSSARETAPGGAKPSMWGMSEGA